MVGDILMIFSSSMWEPMLCVLAIIFFFPHLTSTSNSSLSALLSSCFTETSIVIWKYYRTEFEEALVYFFQSKESLYFFSLTYFFLIMEILHITCCSTKIILSDSIFSRMIMHCLKMQNYYKVNRKLGTSHFDASSAFWKTCRTWTQSV